MPASPPVATTTPCCPYVYWKGRQGDLWEARWSAAQARWVGPVDKGAYGLSTPPTAVVSAAGTAYAFWRDGAGNLVGGQSPPGDAAGPFTAQVLGMGPLGSAPTVVIDAAGSTYVYWRGTNAHLYEGYWGNQWLGPLDRGMSPLGS